MRNLRFRGAPSVAAVFALATSFVACDAIIGIEELQVKQPPPNNGLSCTTPADCPAASNPCFLRACTSAGVCELRDVEPGFVLEVQTPGDCITVACQGGAATDTFDVADIADDGNLCTQETCVEGVGLQTGPAPAGTDCGGQVCDGAGNCVECNGPGECSGTEICQGNTCVAATCDDDVQSGNETDEDCGGECLPCADGLNCNTGADCESGVCDDTCQAPACDDKTQNGSETDVDCGGGCPGCGLNQMCMDGGDCAPQLNYCVCEKATCTCETPDCFDGVENGTEVDVDCGPSCGGLPGDPDDGDHTCLDGMPCQADDWCQSFVCGPGNMCAVPTCDDGVANGDEGGIDCDCPIAPIAGCPDCTEGCA